MEHTEELGVMAGILIPLALFAMIFGIVYLSKRERMAMIERGMDPRRYKQEQVSNISSLKWGFLLMGAGFGLFLSFFFSQFVFSHLDESDNAALHFSLIALCGGCGLFISHVIERNEAAQKEENEKRNNP